MRSTKTVLGVLRERGRRGLPRDELYRQPFIPQLYPLAYGRIYANHGAMAPGSRIHDQRLPRLVHNMLKAGYLEDWNWGATLSGAPQGEVASPVLSNIHLHMLDEFVETVLIPE